VRRIDLLLMGRAQWIRLSCWVSWRMLRGAGVDWGLALLDVHHVLEHKGDGGMNSNM
jgi:hypothetical protein